jgi:uncharacterized protein YukE
VSENGGGGSISVQPVSLAAAGSATKRVSTDATAVWSSLTGAGSTPAACDPLAASSYNDMQAAWENEVDRLAALASAVAGSLTAAGSSYTGTDQSVAGGFCYAPGADPRGSVAP